MKLFSVTSHVTSTTITIFAVVQLAAGLVQSPTASTTGSTASPTSTTTGTTTSSTAAATADVWSQFVCVQ